MAAVCWAAVYSTALAQETEKKSGGGSWMLAYGLVFLGVGLGMLLVCRSSRRRDRLKPTMFAKSQQEDDE